MLLLRIICHDYRWRNLFTSPVAIKLLRSIGWAECVCGRACAGLTTSTNDIIVALLSECGNRGRACRPETRCHLHLLLRLPNILFVDNLNEISQHVLITDELIQALNFVVAVAATLGQNRTSCSPVGLRVAKTATALTCLLRSINVDVLQGVP